MNQFQVRDGSIRCEDVSLGEIAEAVGTPAYVYSGAMLDDAAQSFNDAFAGVPHLICYGIKANSNLTILKRLAASGFGFDAVSGGELFRALEIGAPPEKVILSGVGKRRDEIAYGLRSRILFISVESRAELETIAEVAAELDCEAPVVLRTNPNVDAKTHPYISTGLRSHKFGIDTNDTLQLALDAAAMPHIDVCGIGCHIGSQITELAPFDEAAASLVAMAANLKGRNVRLRYLDFGGGLGIPYDGETPPTAKAYADTLIRNSKRLGMTLILEPGRAITGSSGILLSRVIRKKRQGEKSFVILDAGMTDLIRPPLYGSFHDVRPVRPRDGFERVDLVGPICESTDFIAKDRKLERLEPGDLVAVMTAGAYGSALASNYNSRTRPAEVLVDGGRFRVIRRRETYDDLVRLERSDTG